MIGCWQRFGEGPPPADGEALVFVQHVHDIEMLFSGGWPEADIAIHRSGVLHLQGGAVICAPYRCWWTSLPPTSARA